MAKTILLIGLYLYNNLIILISERPGCFFFVGAGLPGEVRPHHKSVFDFDEEAILVGASVFVNIIRDVLG